MEAETERRKEDLELPLRPVEEAWLDLLSLLTFDAGNCLWEIVSRWPLHSGEDYQLMQLATNINLAVRSLVRKGINDDTIKHD